MSAITSYTALVDVYGGHSKGETGGATWDSELWSGCGPTVLAEIAQGSLGMRLSLAIHDLGEYRKSYVDPQKQAPVAVDLDL